MRIVETLLKAYSKQKNQNTSFKQLTIASEKNDKSLINDKC